MAARVDRRWVLLLAVLLPLCAIGAPASGERPSLILAITIDQLRGDMLQRFGDRFGTGGFRHLLDNGVVYTNAHYRHSNTFTAVGHATLFTGGNSAQHGLAGNDWYDYQTGEQVYCVEDDEHPLIGREYKPHTGTSPRNLTSTTYGDELIMATDGRARVFSVSIKDRGAILPGGQLGKAFWYSSSSGKFVTSTYYYDEYPAWAAAWNDTGHADRYRSESWSLLQDPASYVYAESDDRAYERSYKHLGRVFPHKLAAAEDKDYYAALRFTPMGDELTLEFAKELVRQEKVGQGEATDMLQISFSATDYIGHAFGPNSLESEDNLLRLDRTLADLLQFIDEQVGLERTLIVLSSDHGTDAVPEHKAAIGMTSGRHYSDKSGRHYPETFIEATNAALKARYDTDKSLVVAFWNPSLYLDLEAVEALDLDVVEVERALRDEIMKVPGIAFAATRTDLLAGDVTEAPLLRLVQRAFHPKRSGNVLIVQDQGWYLYPKPEEFAAMHGSPYAYDTHVPILFVGPGIASKTVSRRVGPEDIAATVAALLGIEAPSGSVGDVLYEVVDR